MNSALKAYGSQKATGWTRIEMLLAIYDGAIKRIGYARESLSAGNASEAEHYRLGAQRLVLQLISGIDLQFGDLASQIHGLCVHVASVLSNSDEESLAHCSEVLQTLREGFAGIKEEAVTLESDGEIPPLRVASDVDLLVP